MPGCSVSPPPSRTHSHSLSLLLLLPCLIQGVSRDVCTSSLSVSIGDFDFRISGTRASPMGIFASRAAKVFARRRVSSRGIKSSSSRARRAALFAAIRCAPLIAKVLDFRVPVTVSLSRPAGDQVLACHRAGTITSRAIIAVVIAARRRRADSYDTGNNNEALYCRRIRARTCRTCRALSGREEIRTLLPEIEYVRTPLTRIENGYGYTEVSLSLFLFHFLVICFYV